MFNGKLYINRSNNETLNTAANVAEVKAQLNILEDERDDEAFIGKKILAAQDTVANYTNHFFAKTQVVWDIYNFSDSYISFDESPLIKVVSIEYSEDRETWTAMEEFTDYFVWKKLSKFGMEFADKIVYPYLRVTAQLGYESSECPEDAKAAIILKAADLFDAERSSYNPAKVVNNLAYERLLAPYYNFQP